jgi:hypothetical protein
MLQGLQQLDLRIASVSFLPLVRTILGPFRYHDEQTQSTIKCGSTMTSNLVRLPDNSTFSRTL